MSNIICIMPIHFFKASNRLGIRPETEICPRPGTRRDTMSDGGVPSLAKVSSSADWTAHATDAASAAVKRLQRTGQSIGRGKAKTLGPNRICRK